jgi:hypothetical protein
VRLPHAAECNKAPFMYEMKGALFGYAAPARPVPQLRRSSSASCPAAPYRAVRLPVRPSATRRPPVPGPRGKYRFPGLFRAPGEPPGWCPFPAVKTFLRPSCPIPQELPGILFEFFLVHTLSTEFRRLSAHRGGLSTASFTACQQVTWRNSENTNARSPYPCVLPRLAPLLRRGCGIHVVRATWLGHPRLISGRRQCIMRHGSVPGAQQHQRPAPSAYAPATGRLPRPSRAPARRGMCREIQLPLPGGDLPWIHDHTPGAEATGLHEPDVAASGCPERPGGRRVSAYRHLPAAVLGKKPRETVSFTPDRISRPVEPLVQAG